MTCWAVNQFRGQQVTRELEANLLQLLETRPADPDQTGAEERGDTDRCVRSDGTELKASRSIERVVLGGGSADQVNGIGVTPQEHLRELERANLNLKARLSGSNNSILERG